MNLKIYMWEWVREKTFTALSSATTVISWPLALRWKSKRNTLWWYISISITVMNRITEQRTLFYHYIRAMNREKWSRLISARFTFPLNLTLPFISVWHTLHSILTVRSVCTVNFQNWSRFTFPVTSWHPLHSMHTVYTVLTIHLSMTYFALNSHNVCTVLCITIHLSMI